MILVDWKLSCCDSCDHKDIKRQLIYYFCMGKQQLVKDHKALTIKIAV